MVVLGIETSCDETAAAVIDDHALRTNVVLSQLNLHRQFGGVVPELASRAHLRAILPIIHKAINDSGYTKFQLEGIAVTKGPGLIGALLVGLNFAKAVALALQIPIVGINHLEGHIFANLLEHPDIKLPFICLIVSGGHTQLVLVEDWGVYKVLGRTIDDAAGEAFDKVAKLLKIGYPGGPVIDRLSQQGDSKFVDFPRAWMGNENLDFSFSGLKTAVLNYVQKQPPQFLKEHLVDIVSSFQAAVLDVLVGKTLLATQKFGVNRIALAGGVARNTALRQRFSQEADKNKMELYLPTPDFCTDNAAMISCAGLHYLKKGVADDLELDVSPSLNL
ncbi:tRNA (adenosine(37)-N6)-threonylcarbamoyltransferase complex transferase subunit TsaD [candidate division KSB1 bacterium]|nr:MAG: tRNA (adenosine(37)-N6)-threonylcarbamoyltransferase complex transferase subunit TsaD [candidate division KSB1 bacterium 4484_219]RKY80142.1 MAG: tRNA (adenosine(37)-N6)-threonylcarbamoyltransferase complex transferase subunit TsaD [candidate division KSB1 bacterium]RKY92048.1 MAG: tRNA (adenosine(37)-N6)-threonylcarbamoyltransferase complex transferase subunit TsaD [candidate division KSB1 bacterium]